MSTPDENAPKTDTSPLLDTAAEDAQGTAGNAEPRPAGQEAMEDALTESGQSPEEMSDASDEDSDPEGPQ